MRGGNVRTGEKWTLPVASGASCSAVYVLTERLSVALAVFAIFTWIACARGWFE